MVSLWTDLSYAYDNPGAMKSSREFPEIVFPQGYQVLRPLTSASPVYLCSEHATGRLVVLKFFARSRERVFAQEAKVLDYLSGFDGSPFLYFASQHPIMATATASALFGEFAFYMGLEYLAGKSLALLKVGNRLVADEVVKLAEDLRAQVRRLHHERGMAHGDLSPHNVLVVPSSDGKRHRIVFVDWEFAVCPGGVNLDHYTKFRGTAGYSEAPDLGSLRERDERAIEACIGFLAEGVPEACEKLKSSAAGIGAPKHRQKLWGFRWIWDQNSST